MIFTQANWAPGGYQYDDQGKLISEYIAGGPPFWAPVGYIYTRQGKLRRLKGYKPPQDTNEHKGEIINESSNSLRESNAGVKTGLCRTCRYS